jgi:hypothetical protein
MAYLKFDGRDVKYVAEKLGMNEDDVVEILEEAENYRTDLTKREFLEILISPPMLWGDFVGDIDLSHWEWDESAIRKEKIVEWVDEYDRGVIYVSKRDIEDDPDLHIVAKTEKWILVWWGDFAKVREISGIYVGVVPSRFGYSADFWTTDENEALRWLEKERKRI